MAGFLARIRSQDPRAENAFRLAATWGAGQTIGGLDSLGHAVNVVNTLGRYTPDVPPQVVAACLVDAIPRWPMANQTAHDLVEARCGVEARLLLEALRAEQAVLAAPSDRAVEGHLRLLRTMPWLASATIASKIVALHYTSGRSPHGRDAEEPRGPFTSLDRQAPYLRRLHELPAGIVPPSMSRSYLRLLEQCLPMTTATANR